ncbi:MAG: hypothetical protein M1114_03285 [Candidatus Dependentiae bacterium]|nr:hypothetical protein [Candidatus Dependentiae bacterium]
MNFSTFLQTFTSSRSLPKKYVFLFHGTSYQPLFFSKLLEQIKTFISIETIDIIEQDFTLVQSRLQTSFLGQSVVYWLKNSADLDEKAANKLNSYLQSYTGPHTIICFLSLKNKPINTDFITALDVDEVKIDQDYFLRILHFIGAPVDIKKIQPIIKYLVTRRLSLSLDDVCLISHYISVCTVVGNDFLEWLDTILYPDKALFTLSQLFFAKNVTVFYTQWKQQESQYTEAFWLSFWSEQLWRAAAMIELYEKKEFSQAKVAAFRLPFSLVQSDWKKYSLNELRAAHNFIYDIDYQLKNGADQSVTFDLFYSKFFSGQFK